MRSPFLKTLPAIPLPLHWYLFEHTSGDGSGKRTHHHHHHHQYVHSTAGATCCDSSSILSSVLEVVEGFVEVDGRDVLVRLVFPVAKDETDNSTHVALALCYAEMTISHLDTIFERATG